MPPQDFLTQYETRSMLDCTTLTEREILEHSCGALDWKQPRMLPPLDQDKLPVQCTFVSEVLSRVVSTSSETAHYGWKPSDTPGFVS